MTDDSDQAGNANHTEDARDLAASAAARYRERLRVPASWWLLAGGFSVSIWLAFAVALPTPLVWSLTGLATAAVVSVLVGYGRVLVEVGPEGVRGGPATLPWWACGRVAALDDDAAGRLRGVGADARAYLLVRPYLSSAVRIEVTDPGDPTPYWMVSSRRPNQLAAAIQAARPRS